MYCACCLLKARCTAATARRLTWLCPATSCQTPCGTIRPAPLPGTSWAWPAAPSATGEVRQSNGEVRQCDGEVRLRNFTFLAGHVGGTGS